jgi:hypothetical protein
VFAIKLTGAAEQLQGIRVFDRDAPEERLLVLPMRQGGFRVVHTGHQPKTGWFERSHDVPDDKGDDLFALCCNCVSYAELWQCLTVRQT